MKAELNHGVMAENVALTRELRYSGSTGDSFACSENGPLNTWHVCPFGNHSETARPNPSFLRVQRFHATTLPWLLPILLLTGCTRLDAVPAADRIQPNPRNLGRLRIRIRP
jgi:hypothetical protein